MTGANLGFECAKENTYSKPQKCMLRSVNVCCREATSLEATAIFERGVCSTGSAAPPTNLTAIPSVPPPPVAGGVPLLPDTTAQAQTHPLPVPPPPQPLAPLPPPAQ